MDSEEEVAHTDSHVVRALQERLKPGCRVLVADGVGAPLGLLAPLAEAARAVGGVEIVLGWFLGSSAPRPNSAITTVRSYLGGYGLSGNREVRFTAARLGSLPALIAGPWRPQLLLVGLASGPDGPCFGTEMSWMPAAMRSAEHVVAELNHALPAAGHPVFATDRVEILSEVNRPPVSLPRPTRTPQADQIGGYVASLVSEGASIQFGPGIIGEAAVRAIQVPVRIDSGIVGDAVLDLERRGLLVGDPQGAYIAGSPALYEWADGRRLLEAVETTHDLTRLSQLALVAINTALEIDHVGQVNVEAVGGRTIAGIGGLADFALAASQAVKGLSIIALPTVRGGRRTLVEKLSAPVSCTRSDVDVVVTENGYRDLRGLSDAERAQALTRLW